MKLESYLSSKMSELPVNCLYNKGKVGCGGTTLAINSKKPYVICVPYISLCENKVNQNENLFWFKSETTKKELDYYLENTEISKIICVYDAIEKLSKWINTEDYSILIDELHILCKDYSFRNLAARKVLKSFRLFKEFTFMTATPVEEEFLLDELINIPIINTEWENKRIVKVNAFRCLNSVDETTAELIYSFLNGTNEGNAYIFVNSVEFIKKMIELCNLNKNNTRVIFSKSNTKKVGIENGSTLDEPKKINFLTSTVFEGSDVYDENGRIIIVCDNRKSHTFLDISTSIIQIAGRIKNTKYWNEITHLYTSSRYLDVTYEEFKERSLKEVEVCKKVVKELNSLSDDAINKIKEEDGYVRKENNVFLFDPNMVKIDMLNFKIEHSLYSFDITTQYNSNLVEEYNKYGFKVDTYNHIPSLIIPREDVERANIWDILDEVERENELVFTFKPVTDEAFKKYNWLEEAINKIGYNRMREIHNITRVKELLINMNDINSNTDKILKRLKLKLSIGDFISSKESKELFKTLYNELGIKKTAKGTDIMNYYEVKESTKKINNKSTNGFTIIRSKIIVKQ